MFRSLFSLRRVNLAAPARRFRPTSMRQYSQMGAATMPSDINPSELRREFDQLDVDGDNMLDFKKIGYLLGRICNTGNENMTYLRAASLMDELEVDSHGLVSWEELERALGAANAPVSVVTGAAAQTTEEAVSPSEVMLRKLKDAVMEEELRALFDQLDADEDGFIKFHEVSFALADMCGSDLKRYEEATALFNVLDVNKRGKVSYSEFVEAVKVARQQ